SGKRWRRLGAGALFGLTFWRRGDPQAMPDTCRSPPLSAVGTGPGKEGTTSRSELPGGQPSRGETCVRVSCRLIDTEIGRFCMRILINGCHRTLRSSAPAPLV